MNLGSEERRLVRQWGGLSVSLKVSQGILVFCYLAFKRHVTIKAKLKMSKVLGMAAGCTEENQEQCGAQSQTAGGIPVQHFTECYRGQSLLSSVFLLMKQNTIPA